MVDDDKLGGGGGGRQNLTYLGNEFNEKQEQ